MEAALINDSTSYDSSSNSIVETESKFKFILRIVLQIQKLIYNETFYIILKHVVFCIFSFLK